MPGDLELMDAYGSPSDAEYLLGVLKGAIGAIPLAGSVLKEVLFDTRSRIRHKRLEHFAEEIASRLLNVEQGLLDLQRAKSEEFLEYTESIVSKALALRSRKLRAALAGMLLQPLKISALPDYDFADEFSSIVMRLTDPEMIILTHLYDYAVWEKNARAAGQNPDMGTIDYGQEIIFGVAPHVFSKCFDLLITKGLAFDDSFGRLSTSPRSIIKPTMLAISFVEFVLESGSIGVPHSPDSSDASGGRTSR